MALVFALLSSIVSGQQPKRSREPYITPLLPAEPAWSIALPAPPSAAAAMDERSIYVPLQPSSRLDDAGEEIRNPSVLVALARDTGETRWTCAVETSQPPVLTHGVVLVAAGAELQAIDPADGKRVWSFRFERPVRAPMIAKGSLLLALLEGEELLALDVDTRRIAWRRSIGESGPVSMTADDTAAYLTTAASRALRVNLADGSMPWERPLQGSLSQPTIDSDLLLIGSDASHGSLWALDAATGRDRWVWGQRNGGNVFGGPVVGTAVAGDTVYAVSKDNMIRALNRRNGNQRWQKPAGTRPTQPPQLFEGIVAVSGGQTFSTFRADTGAPIATWSGPDNGILQGPLLLDDPKPLRVSIVALFRDPRIIGLRPAAMLFKEPALVPLPSLPGRELARER